MTKLVLAPEENRRRALAMRADVENRKQRTLADRHAFDNENPIYTVLWDTLTWLVDDNVFLLGYFNAISNGHGLQHVSSLEESARRSGIPTRADRCLDLYAALTCEDPVVIADPALRKLIAMARLQEAATHRREVAPAIAQHDGGAA
jgi:hypothetical protein